MFVWLVRAQGRSLHGPARRGAARISLTLALALAFLHTIHSQAGTFLVSFLQLWRRDWAELRHRRFRQRRENGGHFPPVALHCAPAQPPRWSQHVGED